MHSRITDLYVNRFTCLSIFNTPYLGHQIWFRNGDKMNQMHWGYNEKPAQRVTLWKGYRVIKNKESVPSEAWLCSVHFMEIWKRIHKISHLQKKQKRNMWSSTVSALELQERKTQYQGTSTWCLVILVYHNDNSYSRTCFSRADTALLNMSGYWKDQCRFSNHILRKQRK